MSSMFREDIVRILRDKENRKDFGEAIARVDIAVTLSEARRSCGVTQVDLARELGARQSYIAKLERGDANPSVGTIGRFLAALGLRLSTHVIPLAPRVSPDMLSQPLKTSDDDVFLWGADPMVSIQYQSGAYDAEPSVVAAGAR